MESQTVRVGSAVGIHARPAAMIAHAAASYEESVTLEVAGGKPVDAASTLMVMTMGANFGDEVTVRSTNPAAVAELVALIGRELDAPASAPAEA